MVLSLVISYRSVCLVCGLPAGVCSPVAVNDTDADSPIQVWTKLEPVYCASLSSFT